MVRMFLYNALVKRTVFDYCFNFTLVASVINSRVNTLYYNNLIRISSRELLSQTDLTVWSTDCQPTAHTLAKLLELNYGSNPALKYDKLPKILVRTI